jgi:dCMP deaminase
MKNTIGDPETGDLSRSEFGRITVLDQRDGNVIIRLDSGGMAHLHITSFWSRIPHEPLAVDDRVRVIFSLPANTPLAFRKEEVTAVAPGAPLSSPPRRTSWDAYFMQIAMDVASRATCDRKHVGAVIMRDKIILATGYNGSIRGLAHCDEDGHLMDDTREDVRALILGLDKSALASKMPAWARTSVSVTDVITDLLPLIANALPARSNCIRTIHAEANAIIQAARAGVRIEGGTIYVTTFPCWGCFKMIANAGLARIVFGDRYRFDEPGPQRVVRLAAELKIELYPMNCRRCNAPYADTGQCSARITGPCQGGRGDG